MHDDFDAATSNLPSRLRARQSRTDYVNFTQTVSSEIYSTFKRGRQAEFIATLQRRNSSVDFKATADYVNFSQAVSSEIYSTFKRGHQAEFIATLQPVSSSVDFKATADYVNFTQAVSSEFCSTFKRARQAEFIATLQPVNFSVAFKATADYVNFSQRFDLRPPTLTTSTCAPCEFPHDVCSPPKFYSSGDSRASDNFRCRNRASAHAL